MRCSSWLVRMMPEIKEPRISEQTLKAMTEFFLKTSIPRILKEKEGLNDSQRSSSERTY